MADHEVPPGPEATSPPNRVEIDIRMRTVWRIVIALLIAWILLWAVVQAASLLELVALSFFFSLALLPGVLLLQRRFHIRRGAAVGIIYLGGFVFAVLLIVIVIPAVAQLARTIGDHGAEWAGQVNDWLKTNLGLDIFPSQGAQEAAGQLDTVIADFVTHALGSLVGVATTTIGFIFSLATLAMFTFYFTADFPRFQRAVLSRLDPTIQERVGWAWDEAIVQTGGYFYSRVILMLINGTGFFFTMVLVGVPTGLALALAVFGGFVSVFIPAIGTYIGGAIPILVTLAVQGLVAGLVVLGYVLVYQQLENYWLSPRISAGTMNLNGAVAFGAALFGGAVAGPIGAFVALPVAAFVTSLIGELTRKHEVVYRSVYDTAALEEEAAAAASAEDEVTEEGPPPAAR